MAIISVTMKDGTTSLQAEEGCNLLTVLREAGVFLSTPCGGRGTCGKCKVLLQGKNETSKSFRLACQVQVESDLLVEIVQDEGDGAVILTEGEVDVPLSPSVTKRFVTLNQPSVKDQAADVERVETSLSLLESISPAMMPALADTLRKHDFQLTAVVFDGKTIALEGGDTSKNMYGLAVDIGTTTVVGYLLDLSTGAQVGVCSTLNPQRTYGADVIRRIDVAKEPEGLQTLSRLIREEVNKMVSHFVSEYGVSAANIYHIVLAGNTVMMHLFAGLPVYHMAVSPYIPVVTRRLDLKASELGINVCPGAVVTVLPMVAAYVGADTLAAILASKMAEQEDLSLMIDIGTNGEIALGNKDKIIACSTAAGPAFEGAHIRHGLGGVRGAINSVRLQPKVAYTTIGGAAARGICGSGIVDAVAELANLGILESLGRLRDADELEGENLPGEVLSRLKEADGTPAYLLASKSEGAEDDIYIVQRDVREVQLAKAAIAAGIQILVKEMGIELHDIAHVYLAGGFGNYIDRGNATRIGLIPRELQDKVVPIGNGAGVGAKMTLLSREHLRKMDEIKQKVRYIELSTRKDFQDMFVECMEFSSGISDD